MSATRPWVNAFADLMEKKLAQNRHKGDRDGWALDAPLALLKRLKEEVRELEDVLKRQRANQDDGLDHGPTGAAERRAVVGEAADVANFAMMIADVAGGLKAKAPR